MNEPATETADGGRGSASFPASLRLSEFARWWPLALGLIILASLWLSPLTSMARRAFSPHMMLHLGVTVVAAPLVALGCLRLGLRPDNVRRPALVALAASGVEMVVVWGWHAPAMHDAAAAHDAMFVIQQLSFFAAGFVLWTASFAGQDRAAHGLGALAMLFTFMHMAMLGVLLALAPELIYSPLYCLGAWGLEPLADQRLGGALMAVGGGLPYLFGGLALSWKLLSD